MQKAIVIDLDDTLFIPSNLSRFLFWLSNQIFKIGLIFEKLDKTSFNLMNNYSKKIILTARADNWMNKVTFAQLKHHKVPFDSVIMCPRGKLYMDWKKQVVKALREEYDLNWVDDQRKERS